MPSASQTPLLYQPPPSAAAAELAAATVHLPRLLCLHGGGTTAAIFRRQCRSLVRAFAPYFRLVFADAPYLADAPGPDAAALAAVYPPARYGPFRRWLRAVPGQPGDDGSSGGILSGDGSSGGFRSNDDPDADAEVAAAIERAMCDAMAADDEAGGRGAWVGLLGFSQGAKVAASVLFETQVRRDAELASRGQMRCHYFAGVDWRFGILLAGRAPLVALGEHTIAREGLERPGGGSGGRCGPPPAEHRLWLPAVHVHGLADAGLHLHRALYADFTVPGSAELVEWDGDHRVAIRSKDVQSIVHATLRAAKVSRPLIGRADAEPDASIVADKLPKREPG